MSASVKMELVEMEVMYFRATKFIFTNLYKLTVHFHEVKQPSTAKNSSSPGFKSYMLELFFLVYFT